MVTQPRRAMWNPATSFFARTKLQFWLHRFFTFRVNGSLIVVEFLSCFALEKLEKKLPVTSNLPGLSGSPSSNPTVAEDWFAAFALEWTDGILLLPSWEFGRSSVLFAVEKTKATIWRNGFQISNVVLTLESNFLWPKQRNLTTKIYHLSVLSKERFYNCKTM